MNYFKSDVTGTDIQIKPNNDISFATFRVGIIRTIPPQIFLQTIFVELLLK